MAFGVSTPKRKEKRKTERNSSQLEREAVALVFGVTKFRDYLLVRSFILITDRKPLVGQFREDLPKTLMATVQIQRLELLLGAYQCKIEYKPGSGHQGAAAFSRLLSTEAPKELPE